MGAASSHQDFESSSLLPSHEAIPTHFAERSLARGRCRDSVHISNQSYFLRIRLAFSTCWTCCSLCDLCSRLGHCSTIRRQHHLTLGLLHMRLRLLRLPKRPEINTEATSCLSTSVDSAGDLMEVQVFLKPNTHDCMRRTPSQGRRELYI